MRERGEFIPVLYFYSVSRYKIKKRIVLYIMGCDVKMNIKGIIFDKDGTLMDFAAFWVPVAENAVQYTIDALKLDVSLFDDMLNAIGAYSGIHGMLCYGTYEQIADALYTVLHEKNNFAINRQRLSGILSEAFHSSIEHGAIIPTCDNIVKVFSDLKESGKMLALVTTDDAYITEKCLKTLGIYEYFDRIYTDDGIHPSKPDAYYIYRFCAEENLLPDEIAVVGDTMTDILFAKNGNCVSIGVAKNSEDREALSKSADYVIRDISQINRVLG